jgi:hypothetical protein
MKRLPNKQGARSDANYAALRLRPPA